MKERLIIPLLYLFDFIMDLATLGRWGRVRGDEVVVVKLRK
jgi:hypothetical protein